MIAMKSAEKRAMASDKALKNTTALTVSAQENRVTTSALKVPIQEQKAVENALQENDEDELLEAILKIKVSEEVVKNYGKFVDKYLQRISDEIIRNSIKPLAMRIIQYRQEHNVVLPLLISYGTAEFWLNADITILISMLPEAAELKAKEKDELDAAGYRILVQFFRIWLKNASFVIENQSTPPITTKSVLGESVGLTVDWTRKYESAEKVFIELITQSIFKENAIKVLSKKFFNDNNFKNWKIGDRFWDDVISETGEYSDPDKKHEKQFQYIKHEKLVSTSGLSACLHNFCYYALVAGKISDIKFDVPNDKDPRNCSVIAQEVKVVIDRCAVYIRDIFDFTGDQFPGLGTWKNPQPNSSSFWLTNKDFRRYQKATGFGSDFLIFTKNKEVKLEEKKWETVELTLK